MAQKPKTTSTSPSRWNKPACRGNRWERRSNCLAAKVCSRAMAKIAAAIHWIGVSDMEFLVAAVRRGGPTFATPGMPELAPTQSLILNVDAPAHRALRLRHAHAVEVQQRQEVESRSISRADRSR